MSEQLDQQILAAQEAVTKQGDTVRSLKAGKKDGKVEQVLTTLLTSYNILPAMGVTAHVCVAQAEIDAAIQQLKELKLELEEKQKVRGPAVLKLRNCEPMTIMASVSRLYRTTCYRLTRKLQARHPHRARRPTGLHW